ncbi:MAG TPA: isoleucine--tRNA ligase [Firmicutes bacterium]|nr:isoleucine--tRNA ligase [Bacillota bacterium]HAW99551.1 isoleucine--tRNA ligase [Bacillota bacterium]
MELKKTLIMNKGDFEMRANLAQKEPTYVKHWSEMDLYHKMLEKNDGREAFYLHDGPPYANGDMHAGHALNKILKDMIIRYKSLKGFYTPFTPGWDTHGLPIENAVVKNGVDRKTTPIVDFRKQCAKYAFKQVDRQRKQLLRLGVVGDYENPYITLTKEYEKGQIEIFADMALKGYIYKGLKPVNWSPSSESALAEAEIEYKDVTAKTIYVRFQVTEAKGPISVGDYFVIWTTTPWTLPANLAICLNPLFTYGVFKTDKGNLIFLKSKAEELKETLGLSECELIKEFKGSEVELSKCKHPYYDKDSLIIIGDYVSDDAGTGCVHIAPGHGLDDFKVCLKYGIKPYCPVDEHGYMTKDAGEELAGLFYEEANDKSIELLERNGALLKLIEITHSYPHDWRTGKPLIFRATPQWFCSLSAIKQNLLDEVEKVSYSPKWGKVRLHNMIEGREDWCISRQRAWGVPIPIIYAEDGTAILDKKVFDHIAELIGQYGSNVWYEREAKDLLPEGYTTEHSPNGLFTKEKDIMDVWFDSGSSFRSVDMAKGYPYPADLYLEGNDQYRGWYNSSLILAVATTGIAPYKSIVTHGMIVDGNGEKFSKSKGNGVDPNKICDTYGADILRLWVSTIDFQAESKLSEELIKIVSESYRKIRNTFKFMLANLFDDAEHVFDPECEYELSELDKMILAKLNSLMETVDKEYASYDFIGVQSAIFNFMVNDLSAFYLDLAKDVLYCDAVDSLRRKGVQKVLYEMVRKLSIALSPILPFTMEEVNDHLHKGATPGSIALSDYPTEKVDEVALNEYKNLVAIRNKALKLLEVARSNGLFGQNPEASLTLSLEGEQLVLANKLGEEELARILQVAKVTLGENEGATKFVGERCERCWCYFDHLEEDSEGHHICERCAEVIKHE